MKNNNKINYFRVVELIENIDKLNKIIELHQNTTKDDSMIKQYAYKKGEIVLELQMLFRRFNLDIVESLHQSQSDEISNTLIVNTKVNYRNRIESPKTTIQQVVNESPVNYKKIDTSKKKTGMPIKKIKN